ncbi:proenkephalin b [Polyodon spathula]|uniref:proenkephalin b n=1 Tax=Polyodon spathula TaxID=7913 RepID=UPI001B7F1299|nr:proenkephalin b [Polyodon spathula]
MALTEKCTCWMLVLNACLILTVQAECGKDCAYCIYHLQDRHAEINTVTCTLECERKLLTTKTWEVCKNVLQGNQPQMSTEQVNDPLEGVNQENGDHQLAKKYGGFMERYGGFTKKMAELYNVEPDDDNDGSEILAKRYGGFMKKDVESGSQADTAGLLREILNAGDSEVDSNNNKNHDGEITKRYGGFMRSIKRNLDLEDGIKELQKRYGGFMRRVGRPDWKENNKRYEWFSKQPKNKDSKEINSEEVEKRYGGFMGY